MEDRVLVGGFLMGTKYLENLESHILPSVPKMWPPFFYVVSPFLRTHLLGSLMHVLRVGVPF